MTAKFGAWPRQMSVGPLSAMPSGPDTFTPRSCTGVLVPSRILCPLTLMPNVTAEVGVTLLDAADAGPEPKLLAAVTVNV